MIETYIIHKKDTSVTMHFEKLRTLKKNSKFINFGTRSSTLNFFSSKCHIRRESHIHSQN